jgi:hypothetical protein
MVITSLALVTITQENVLNKDTYVLTSIALLALSYIDKDFEHLEFFTVTVVYGARGGAVG